MKIRPGIYSAIGVTIAIALSGCGHPGESEFRRGVGRLNQGQYVDARNCFERSISRRPGSVANAVALNYLGLVCLKLNDIPAAHAAFTESRRLDPSLPEPAFNLALLRAQSGDMLEASSLLMEVAMMEPKSPRAPEMLGHLYLQQKRWNDALKQFEEAAKRDPASARIQTALALALYPVKGPDAAIQSLTAALDHDPKYAPAVHNLFVLYSRALNLPAQAEPYARRFLQLADKNDPWKAHVEAWLKKREADLAAPPARRGTPVRPGTAPSALELTLAQARAAAAASPKMGMALCLKAAEQARIARDETGREKALVTGTQIAFDQPVAHVALGRYLLERKRYSEALATFRHATSLGPNLAEAQAGRGEAALREKEYDDAMVSLRRALELDPSMADARWNLAVAYEEMIGSPADALREYLEFSKRFVGDPRSVKATERARALQASLPPTATVPVPSPATVRSAGTEASPAIPVSGRRLQIKPAASPSPRDAAAALDRGRKQIAGGKYDRAQYEFTRAVQANSASPEAWFNLAEAYRALNDLDLALDALSCGLALDPANTPMRYNAAIALQGLKNTPAAIQQLEYIVRKQPDYAPAHYLLGSIYAADPARKADAVTQLKEFLRLSPVDPLAVQVRAWLAAS